MSISLCKSSVHRMTCTAVALCAMFGTASAMAITISYSGSGAVTGPAQAPPTLTGLQMTAATSSFTIGGSAGWGVDKLFSFNLPTLTGGGTFNFTHGSSGFGGTFISARASTTSPTTLQYTVSGGTGIYAGYAGIGFGYGITIGDPFSLPTGNVSFTEGGFFNISPVPEPASGLLLTLGLGSALLWRRRVLAASLATLVVPFTAQSLRQ